MTKQNPNLKLYAGNESPVTDPESPVPGLVEQLSVAFEQVTGRQLFTEAETSDDPLRPPQSPAAAAAATAATAATDSRLSPSDAEQLADQINQLLGELQRTQRALWQREGDLAAAVPLVVRREDEQGQLAERLEAVLRGGAEAVDCTAAGLYLLDDDTRHLKLRSSWGLPIDRLLAEPRRLRGSKADLEALTGHAVVLDSADRFEHWSAPEKFGSAVCVPVSTATVPLGTLWMFGNVGRPFTDAQVNIVEIVAGRVATELEREILLRQHIEPQAGWDDRSAATALPHWQRWNAVVSLDGWQISVVPGATRGEPTLGHDAWCPYVFEDGRLSFTLAGSQTRDTAGALTAASFRGAAQLVRATLDPADRLHRINEALAALSAGDQACSAIGCTLEPHTGRFEFSTAGEADTYIIRPHGWELVSEPGAAVGVTPDARYGALVAEVQRGDIILTVAAVPPRETRLQSDQYVDANDLAELLLHHQHLSSSQLAELADHLLDSKPTVWPHRPTLLICRREP